MDLHKIVGTAIRSSLLANSNVTALVDGKIYQVAAPPTIQLPYITFWWTGGGYINTDPKQPFNTIFTIVGNATNAGTAQAISEAIANALVGQDPGFPSPWKSWSPITIEDMFHEVINVQNEQYYRYGAVYRFRGLIE
jgi:hypothetical protein